MANEKQIQCRTKSQDRVSLATLKDVYQNPCGSYSENECLARKSMPQRKNRGRVMCNHGPILSKQRVPGGCKEKPATTFQGCITKSRSQVTVTAKGMRNRMRGPDWGSPFLQFFHDPLSTHCLALTRHSP